MPVHVMRLHRKKGIFTARPIKVNLTLTIKRYDLYQVAHVRQSCLASIKEAVR